jgi:adenylate cyclase class IV
MKEIEMKILELPKRIFLEKMRRLGAKEQYRVFIRVKYFDFPDHRIFKKKDLLRIRELSKGKKAAKTEVVYKAYRSLKGGCKHFEEYEFETFGPGKFKTICDFFKHLGFIQTVSYEKKRTFFSHGRLKFEYDEHPKIPPFLEIEAKNPAEIHRIIKRLGLENYERTPETIAQLLKRKYPHVSLNGLSFSRFKSR